MLEGLSPKELILVREYINGPKCQKRMDKFRGSYSDPMPAVVSKKEFDADDEDSESEEE